MRELKQKRPNFYLLLDLPYEPPMEDEAQILAAINRKISEWRRSTNHPKLQQQVKYYLSLKGQIEEVMLNDAQARKQEAKEARDQINAEKHQAKKEKEENLDKAIKILVSQGFVTDDSVKSLAEQFEFSIAEVESKIPKGARQQAQRELKDVKPKVAVKSLDTSVMNKINDLLNKLEVKPRNGKVATLYDFLNMTEDTNGTTLVDLSEKMYRELLRKPPGLAAVDYQKDICGHIKTIFKSEEERKKYDESVRQHRFNHLKLFIDLAARQGVISAPVYKQLVIQATEEGLSQSDTENRINEYCLDQKYQVQLNSSGEQSPANKLVSCGYCGQINEENTKCCVNCGHDLEQECLVCHTVSPTSVNNCRNCGTSFKQMIHFKALMKDGIQALQMDDLEGANQMLTRAQLIFDNDEVKAAIGLLSQKKQRISQQISMVQDLINRRHYYTAEAEWNKLKKIAPNLDEYAAFQREISKSMQELDQIRMKAQGLHEDHDKIVFYLRALEISADCQWAMDRLKQIPPQPPEVLRAETVGNQIKLSWTLSEPEGFVQYKIVRKEETPPAFLEDGVLLGEVMKPFFTDGTTIPGKNYWYGVFALRGQLKARKPVLRGPFLRIAEIEGFHAAPQGDGILLTWKDSGSLVLEVWRKEGIAPRKPGDGVRLQGAVTGRLFDPAVEVGKQYGYTVFTRIVDERGMINYSKGVSVDVFMLDAEPIQDLSYSLKEDAVELTWSEPQKGSVAFYGSATPIPFKLGECYSISTIGQHIPLLSCETQGPGFGRVNLSFSDVFNILPVTVVGDFAIAGKIRVIKKLQDVTDLRAKQVQNQCLLEWIWPQGSEEVAVIYDEKGFPTQPKPEDERQIVYTKNQYDANLGLALNIGENKDLYVSVFIREEFEGTVYFSNGAHIFQTTKTPPRMTYKVGITGVFSKKVKLTLKIDGHQMSIPELLIVKKNGSQPLNSKDGQVICKIEPAFLERDSNGLRIPSQLNEAATVQQDGTITIDLTAHRGKKSYVRVFFGNGQDAKKFTLEPLGKMELG